MALNDKETLHLESRTSYINALFAGFRQTWFSGTKTSQQTKETRTVTAPLFKIPPIRIARFSCIVGWYDGFI